VDCWPDSLEWVESHFKYWRSLFIHNSGICWTIADKESDKMIGSLTLTKLKTIQRKGTFSYDLDYNHWGKGIMKDALEAAIGFCDKQLELLRIEACASQENERSKRLLVSLGFKHEGVMPKYEVLNWNHEDFDAYGRTR
jgi:ribosomal-protein-alanine N-acetyltransferase